MNYLYLIPIPEEKLFKIGITNNLRQRIAQHISSWRNKIKIEDDINIVYISGGENKIKLLEQYLKYTFKNHLAGVDLSGHTEIYKIECLDQLIEEANRFSQNIGVTLFDKFIPENKTKSGPLNRVYPTKEERQIEREKKLAIIDQENRVTMNLFVDFVNSLNGKVQLNYESHSRYLRVVVLEKLDSEHLCEYYRFKEYGGGFNLLNTKRTENDELSFIEYNREMMFYAKRLYPDIWKKINWEFKDVLDGLDKI